MRSDAGRAAMSASLRISVSERGDASPALGEDSDGGTGAGMGLKTRGFQVAHFAPPPRFVRRRAPSNPFPARKSTASGNRSRHSDTFAPRHLVDALQQTPLVRLPT